MSTSLTSVEEDGWGKADGHEDKGNKEGRAITPGCAATVEGVRSSGACEGLLPPWILIC